jgi:uncharacterized membrane protein YeiH
MDAIGLALFSTVGAERGASVGAAPIVAVVMGVITACFGGILRDALGHERSIIFSQEIYVTAAMAAAISFVVLDALGMPREVSMTAAVVIGLSLRAGALLRGWTLPRYRPRAPRV